MSILWTFHFGSKWTWSTIGYLKECPLVSLLLFGVLIWFERFFSVSICCRVHGSWHSSLQWWQICWRRGRGEGGRHDPVDMVAQEGCVSHAHVGIGCCWVGHGSIDSCSCCCSCCNSWLWLKRPLECCAWKNHVPDEGLNGCFAYKANKE